jgi:hypothetical protein
MPLAVTNGQGAQTKKKTSGAMTTTARATVRQTDRRKAPGLAADIADLFQTLIKAVLDPYRPELHYMRGPGPKWHAKHRPALAEFPARAVPVPALIRVRVRR